MPRGQKNQEVFDLLTDAAFEGEPEKSLARTARSLRTASENCSVELTAKALLFLKVPSEAPISVTPTLRAETPVGDVPASPRSKATKKQQLVPTGASRH